jgi:MFS family permease
MWYKRSEAQKRFSFFFSSTTLAGAFGGLLASGLGEMAGLRGYNGWRWVFIIEGVLTCVVSLVWFFVIPDFPEDVKWLNDEEREYIRAKLAKDVGASGRDVKLTVRDVLAVFKDCEWRASLLVLRLLANFVLRQGLHWRSNVLWPDCHGIR